MATEESKKTKKRLIRPAPTIREKAAANHSPSASAQKARRFHKSANAASILFAPLRRLGNTKPMRIIGLIVFPPYFRNSYRELRQVTWPGFRNSIKLTVAVIIFSIIFGLLITVVDFGLGKLFKEVLLK